MQVVVSLNFYSVEQFSLFPDIFQKMLSLRVLNHQIVQEFKVKPFKRQMYRVYFQIHTWNTSNQGIQRSGTLRVTHYAVMFFTDVKRCYILLTLCKKILGEQNSHFMISSQTLPKYFLHFLSFLLFTLAAKSKDSNQRCSE